MVKLRLYVKCKYLVWLLLLLYQICITHYLHIHKCSYISRFVTVEMTKNEVIRQTLPILPIPFYWQARNPNIIPQNHFLKARLENRRKELGSISKSCMTSTVLCIIPAPCHAWSCNSCSSLAYLSFQDKIMLISYSNLASSCLFLLLRNNSCLILQYSRLK